jgi:hypothetical protein
MPTVQTAITGSSAGPITTSGRNVRIELIPGSTGPAFFGVNTGPSGASVTIYLFRNTTFVTSWELSYGAFTGDTVSFLMPPGAISCIDQAPTGGVAYTYSLKWFATGSGTAATMQNCLLHAIEY